MDGLKQRVIGALVLISLAVIFVPMMFDEPHTERSSQAIDIPEEEPFPEVGDSEPDRLQDDQEESPAYRIEEPDEDQTASDTSAEVFEGSQSEPRPVADVDSEEPSQPVNTQPVAAPEETPDGDTQTDRDRSEQAAPETSEKSDSDEIERSLDGAWVVQLGSFGQADNARRLRDRVREEGYDAHTQEIQRGDATLTRVFSGPFAEKSDAENAKKSLDEAFDVNGLVTSGSR